MNNLTNRKFLIIHSSVYTLFAIALFVIPTILWPNYGVQLNDKYAIFLSQHTSIFLGGIAIIGFMLKEVEQNSVIAKKLMLSFVFTNVLGVIITLYASVIGIFHGLGWSDPVFFTLLTILSYIQWKKNQ